jgi:glycosyltransferase involved in cell wall biosynthesis
MTIEVLYDHQIFYYQKLGGISRYFYELINSAQSNYSSHLAMKSHTNLYIKNAGSELPSLGDKPVFFEPKNDIFSKIKRRLPFDFKTSINGNENFVLKQMTNFKPDIFHPTFYDDYFLNKIGETPFVLTIYDMIHEVFPECFPGDNNRMTSFKKKLYSAASQVIAISEHTKKDIMEIFEVSGEKITVIPLANSLICTSEKKNVNEKAKNFVSGKYILFVGGRVTYKNFMFFIASISKLLKKDLGIKVICTGQPFDKSELAYLDSMGLSSKVSCLSVNDKDLSSLYNNAEMFVFPSLYEGFGIPVLEAFACGCPALLSNKTSLPEVGGEAAEYFDPKSAVEIRTTVEKVLYNSAVRKRMVQKGYERLKLFSWDETVRKTGEVYKKCL